VLTDDVGHGVGELLVLGPLRLERVDDVTLGLRVDDVDPDGTVLEEPVDAVDGLDEVVELEPDAGEDRAVAVPLEVAAGAGQDRLGQQQPVLTVGEGDDATFALVEVLRPVRPRGRAR
jgi:hypothetical protein